MDSRATQSHAHGYDEHHHPHNLASQQVTHGVEEHHDDHEKKSVMKKVKAKAKKIKNTITKHGQHDHEHGHEYHYEDQHIPDDHDLDEEDDHDEDDPEIHGAPSGAEINITPVEKSFARMNVHNEQKPILEPKISTESHDQNLPALSSEIKTQNPKSHDQFMSDLSHPSAKSHDQNLSELSSATKTQYPSTAGSHDQSIPDLPTEFKPQNTSATSHGQYLPHSSAIETQYPSGGSHDQFTPEFSTRTTTREIKNNNNNNITVEEQPQPPNQSNSYTDRISSATSAIAEKATTAKNAVASKLGYGEKGDDHHIDNNETGVEKPLNQNQNQSSYTQKISSATSAIADRAASAKNIVASKLGFGEKTEGDSNVTSQEGEKNKSENAASAATSGSAAEYGKRIALSLTDKLAPVYGKVAGVGSAVKSKGSGERASDKGVSVKDYLAEKLRPGEEDKALSEVISGSLYKKGGEEESSVGVHEEQLEDRDVREVVSDAVHKRGEELDEGEVREERRPMGKVTESEEVKRRLGSGDDEKGSEESSVNSPGKGVVDKLKAVVGSWFGKPGENQSLPGSGDLTRNSAAEVEQVNQAAGERKTTGVN